MELIPGITFNFGRGRIYTLAPLTLGALERLQDGLQALATDAALAPASVKTVVSVAHASLLRNYPTLTRDDVLELLDVGNMADVADAAMDVSGLRRKALEEAKKPGSPASAGTDWAAAIAHICANTGWTWCYVRNHCDIPTLNALQAEWERHPPVHQLVASYLGYKSPSQNAVQLSAPEAEADINDLLAELGNVPIRQEVPMNSAAFDAAMKEIAHGRQ